MKNIFLGTLTGIAGLLLTLAGLNLIELTQTLILYTGVVLLGVALLFYLFRERRGATNG